MGGNWILDIPRSEAQSATPAGVLAPGTPFRAPAVNLLGQCQPTIMEAWLLKHIYLPVAVQATPAVPATGEAAILEATATLRIGGDIVWQDTIGFTMPETAFIFHQFTFAADFNNPIEFKRGRTMTLEAEIQSSVELKSTVAVPAAGIVFPALGGGGAVPTQGTIQYESVTLSGHREI